MYHWSIFQFWFSEYLVKVKWRVNHITNCKFINTFIYKKWWTVLLEICKIYWRLYIPNDVNNGIILSVSYLYLPGSYFTLSFQFYHSPTPAWSKNTYHILYDFLLEIHSHQLSSQCFLFFGFVDESFITVLMSWIVLFVFAIIIFVLHGFHIFYSIISISTWHIIFISTWSIYIFRMIIIFSLHNDLNPGRNVGTCGGRL